MERPSASGKRSGGQGPYQVQQTTALGPTTTWENVGEPVQTNSMRIPLGSGNVAGSRGSTGH